MISDVFRKLQEVNVAKATGHDNIPNKILKIAAPVISISLADLFNLSIKCLGLSIDRFLTWRNHLQSVR